VVWSELRLKTHQLVGEDLVTNSMAPPQSAQQHRARDFNIISGDAVTGAGAFARPKTAGRSGVNPITGEAYGDDATPTETPNQRRHHIAGVPNLQKSKEGFSIGWADNPEQHQCFTCDLQTNTMTTVSRQYSDCIVVTISALKE
jgi:hypothetical protein